ncbi:enoyl-CoA hydratase/isomerase family protein [Aureivirga sp. CE67]|uniref:enoyl-CoA hydratase/isomerase family protein n=1 Tax=Aureivirga sp. CE67 TaxID=1788983 RepID=UPI0018C93D4B|nr:enoyl-CoA hydratase/isomerase family protein [Aureivirga sp. CE67]
MNQGTIETNIENKIATVTFFHPASNSFPSYLLAELAETFNQLDKNEEINVIVLKSAKEKAFCAGASFDELLAIDNLEDGGKFFMGFANVINAMRKCSKIIIGRIQGKTVGGGVGLAAACDYAFATDAASIKLSEITIGIGPFVIEPAVERKIGLAATSELSLDATNWRNAKWAAEKGLFQEVFESIETMDISVQKFAERFANYNPEALADLKKVLWKNTENWDTLLAERAEISGKLVLSNFTKEALSKFKK